MTDQERVQEKFISDDIDKIRGIFGINTAWNLSQFAPGFSQLRLMLGGKVKKFGIRRTYGKNITNYYYVYVYGRENRISFEEFFDNMPASIQESIVFNLDLFK